METNKNSLEIIKEQTKFYLNTPERAAEALLFIRNLERFAKEIKDKVKERTIEIMDKNNTDLIEYSITDQETGEIREWVVRRDYGKQTKEYQPENVISALGQEKALQFMKVGKIALEKYLKTASAKGEITMDIVSMAVANPEIKIIKGSGIKIVEIKVK
jgi:hypothetical protein